MKEEVTEPASWAVGSFPGSTMTQWGIRARQCLAARWAGLWQEDEDSKARGKYKQHGKSGSPGPEGKTCSRLSHF